jgi:hypothetical protein
MLRKAAAILIVMGFTISAVAQEKEPRLPKNTIDCKQFKQEGPGKWIEIGTAVFDLGETKDINLTNQPVTPGYFKFGGIDVYPVLEQKCGTPAPAKPIEEPALSTTAQEPKTLEQNAAPKPELKQTENSSVSAQALAALDEHASPLENKSSKGEPESLSCGNRKSVYVADGFTETANGRALIEIAFKNRTAGDERSGLNSEFILREYRGAGLEWAYKGKLRQGRFIFAPVTFGQGNPEGFVFTSMRAGRQDPAVLLPTFVKPNRDGSGEAILYLAGLRALFASKENIRRLRFEGKQPSGSLPEAFYFNRCE